ncbi:MAG: outer membrane beta-barrel protein [Pedobacter sp.]|nr:outer membrane beta-barrel protein [Pedobacter sp.]
MFKKLAVLIALAAPVSAFAGPYLVLGGAMGSADLADVEALYPSTAETDDSFGRALIGIGADINPYLGIEALYMTEAEVSVSTSLAETTLKNSGFQFAVLGKAPLTNQLSLFGKLSGNYLEVKADDTVMGSEKDSNFQLGFGVGLHYQVNDSVGVRLAGERIQIREAINGEGDSDLDQASLAVTFAF